MAPQFGFAPPARATLGGGSRKGGAPSNPMARALSQMQGQRQAAAGVADPRQSGPKLSQPGSNFRDIASNQVNAVNGSSAVAPAAGAFAPGAKGGRGGGAKGGRGRIGQPPARNEKGGGPGLPPRISSPRLPQAALRSSGAFRGF